MPLPKMLTLARFHLLPAPLRRRPRLLAAILALELLLLAGLMTAVAMVAGGGDDDFIALDTLLGERDLPEGWAPVTATAYPYMTNSPLLTLLMEEETVAGAFSAYHDPQDSSAVATYVVFRPHEPLLLETDPNSGSVKKMMPLVIELERLARKRLGGPLPNVFFAATDVPTPGALRGRSLSPPRGEGIQSDSILFSTGPVLALVMIEHPTGEEPFRPVQELAQLVYGRIQQELD